MLKIDKSLVERLESFGIDFIMFSFRWMLCFMSREVELMTVTLNLFSYSLVVNQKHDYFMGQLHRARSNGLPSFPSVRVRCLLIESGAGSE
jgi:hypothetical protein